MRTLYIFKGLPASGKSTEAAELVKREPKRWARINRDDLRAMVVGPGNNPYGDGKNEREEFIRAVKNELIRQSFREGYDVIVDDTHLVTQTVKKLHELAASVGDVKVIEKGVNVSVEECIRRDSLRTGIARVGEKVIRDMASFSKLDKGRKLPDKEAYYLPRFSVDDMTPLEQDENLPKAIICDLDGTLAIMGDRSPYDASRCDVVDRPNTPVIETVLALHDRGYKIIFMSGREDKYREQSVRFIEKYCTELVPMDFPEHKGKGGNKSVSIPYALHMRSTGDSRKDIIVKRELFDAHLRGKYNVVFALDDRNQVVDGWRQMGLTCYQVQPGAF